MSRRAKYFTASWCGPCQSFKPIMESLRAEGHDIEILDIDKYESLSKQYKIASVPTTIIEELIVPTSVVEVSREVGARTRQEIEDLLNG